MKTRYLRSEINIRARNRGAASKPSASVLASNIWRGPYDTVTLERECAGSVWRRREVGREVSGGRRKRGVHYCQTINEKMSAFSPAERF